MSQAMYGFRGLGQSILGKTHLVSSKPWHDTSAALFDQKLALDVSIIIGCK